MKSRYANNPIEGSANWSSCKTVQRLTPTSAGRCSPVPSCRDRRHRLTPVPLERPAPACYSSRRQELPLPCLPNPRSSLRHTPASANRCPVEYYKPPPARLDRNLSTIL